MAAAQTLKEAITKGLVKVGAEIDEFSIQQIEGETRDYLAHELMKFLGKVPENNISEAMHKFFIEIMKENIK